MTHSQPRQRALRSTLLFLAVSTLALAQQTGGNLHSHFPSPEKLTYFVEWRLVNAGKATVQLLRNSSPQLWNFNVDLESAGLVSRLYRVLDTYKITTSDRFCLANTTLDAQEGKKHTFTRINFDGARKKLFYDEHDLVKNTKEEKEVDGAPCTYEIVGALATLRNLSLDPGKSTTIPISDGKKFAQARVEAQARENLSVSGKSYATTRYEAFLFDNVLYKRRGRLLIWISDDVDHLPVQFRILMGFPIGTITVGLQKQEKQ